jgi:hypothetical protein
MEEEVRGAPPHVAAEFYLWLWWQSDTGGGSLSVEEGEDIDFWVDDRIAFRPAGEEKVTAVMTGDNPGSAPEARAAVAGGKVLRDVKLAIRRGEREYQVTLRGTGIEITAAKLPGLLKGGDVEELLYERAFLYEELHWIIGQLFRAFSDARTAPTWRSEAIPELRAWAAARPGSTP